MRSRDHDKAYFSIAEVHCKRLFPGRLLWSTWETKETLPGKSIESSIVSTSEGTRATHNGQLTPHSPWSSSSGGGCAICHAKLLSSFTRFSVTTPSFDKAPNPSKPGKRAGVASSIRPWGMWESRICIRGSRLFVRVRQKLCRLQLAGTNMVRCYNIKRSTVSYWYIKK